MGPFPVRLGAALLLAPSECQGQGPGLPALPPSPRAIMSQLGKSADRRQLEEEEGEEELLFGAWKGESPRTLGSHQHQSPPPDCMGIPLAQTLASPIAHRHPMRGAQEEASRVF